MLLNVLIGFVAFPYGSLAKAAGPEKVIENAITVLTEIKNVPEGGIPKELLISKITSPWVVIFR